jgi:hypothetical protein
LRHGLLDLSGLAACDLPARPLGQLIFSQITVSQGKLGQHVLLVVRLQMPRVEVGKRLGEVMMAPDGSMF